MTSEAENSAHVHPDLDAQSTPAVTELPAELAELRDLHATAMANADAAEAAQAAAIVEYKAAQERWDAAVSAQTAASAAEDKARREYIDALRRHGYVQTADGPKPGSL